MTLLILWYLLDIIKVNYQKVFLEIYLEPSGFQIINYQTLT